MNISVIILSWNSECYLDKCLSSVIKGLRNYYSRYEIFIVDNGSRDGSVDIIEYFRNTHPDHVKSILLNSNKGTTYSRNLALKQAKGKFIVVMDSDTEIIEDVIPKLTHILKYGNNVGLVAPRLMYKNGQLQKSVDNYPTVFTKLHRYFFLKKSEKKMLRIPIILYVKSIMQFPRCGFSRRNYSIVWGC